MVDERAILFGVTLAKHHGIKDHAIQTADRQSYFPHWSLTTSCARRPVFVGKPV
jgi:hypothetical protein